MSALLTLFSVLPPIHSSIVFMQWVATFTDYFVHWKCKNCYK